MINPKDPLRNMVEDPQRELFDRIIPIASGFPVSVVTGAAANLLANAIRQTYPDRDKAAKAFDELVAKTKNLLLEQHYSSVGRKKGIFPYHQTVEVPMLKLPKAS